MTLGWEVSPQLAPLLSTSPPFLTSPGPAPFLPPKRDPFEEDEFTLSFVDFIPRLRQLACEALEAHIQSRQALIEEILKPAQGTPFPFRRVLVA